MKLKAIAAINNLGYLGKDGKLMWKSKEDFKHFKKMTMGGILIVGSKTFENDFGGKELPGRECFVIGKNYNTPWEAINKAILRADEINMANIQVHEECVIGDTPLLPSINIWVVGGAQIYKLFMPFIDEFHISCINDNQTGDVKLELGGLRGVLINYNFEKSE